MIEITTNDDDVCRLANTINRYLHDLFMTRNDNGYGYETCFLSKKQTTKLCTDFFGVVVQYANMNLLTCEHGNRTELQYTFRNLLNYALRDLEDLAIDDFIEATAMKLADVAIALARAICRVFGEMLMFESREVGSDGTNVQVTYYRSARKPRLGKWTTFYLEWDKDLDEANTLLLSSVKDIHDLHVVFPEGLYNPYLGETTTWKN